MLVTAVHQIILTPNKTVEPRTVFDAPDSAVADLARLGAVRDCTKEELALYAMTNPPAATPAAAPQPVASTPQPVASTPSRADLEARAAAAGVEFRANISDAKLLERVLEAESVQPDADVVPPTDGLLV